MASITGTNYQDLELIHIQGENHKRDRKHNSVVVVARVVCCVECVDHRRLNR